MKIYIPNILPISLTDKFDKLCIYFGEPKEKIKYELISKDFGVIIIEEQHISHIEPSFNPDYELIKNYNNYDLLVDRTNNHTVPFNFQFPVNYTYTRFLQNYFKTHKKSKLTLVITYLEETNNNFELIRIPVDFYFEYDSDVFDLKDQFFQEEFNGFLSALN